MPAWTSRIPLHRRVLWVAPAVPAVVATGYLAWGAWVSAAHPQWLYQSSVWWRVWLRPENGQAPLILVLLWLVALLCFWWPRRLLAHVTGLIIVVAMVVIGAVLATASLAPCRGHETAAAVAGWVLSLYAGNPPNLPSAPCSGPPPLALQLGAPVCLAATLAGALAVAAVLWRQPLDRMRARLARDTVVFTGLDALTLPLLHRLALAGRPARIFVIEPDGGHPLLAEARALGARVMIGQPTLPRVLQPVIARGRGYALRRLYALRDDVTENEAVLAAATTVLRRCRPDPERQPHLVARIDDPRHADHWRGAHIGASSLWLEDALSAHESTASGVADEVLHTGAGQVLLCGDSTLALAILRELARRSWEWRELARAAATGRASHPGATSPGEPDPWVAAPFPVRQVVLLDRRANDLLREYQATSPAPIAAALPGVRAEPRPWQGTLLAMLDALTPAAAGETAVIVADAPGEHSMHEAGRVARLHRDIPLFVLTSGGAGTSGVIFDQLQPYQRALLVGGEVPEDTWTRVARHWHECFRLSHPSMPGDPRARTRRPWADLDGFIRQDNILQVRSIMAAVAARGRRWVPGREVVPGSFIELTGADLEQVAGAEHTRWYRRRLAAGWSATPKRGAGTAPPGDALVNSKVVPWAELAPGDRAEAVEHLRSQVAQLEDVGFMPVVPAGGPPGAAEFERVGAVQASQLRARWPWTRGTGGDLSGEAGDWRVRDDRGDERTVRDAVFRASHEPLGGGRWRRTGTYRAWRAGDELVLRTLEGRAIAQPGDWVVEGGSGERWPVADAQFRSTYRAAPDAPGR